MDKRNLNLKFLLIKRNIKNKDLAKVLGKTPTAISKKLNGKAAFKDYELKAIAKYLEFEEEDFYNYFFKDEIA